MEIKYEDKIVAFIDVLGFSEIVYSNTTESINRYFELVSNEFQSVVVKNQFRLILISDSIVVSTKHTNNNLKILIRILWGLQARLLVHGILLRGAISFGNLFLNKSKNIIVGPGLINAYKMESQAIYPRIILDRRFINEYYTGIPSLINDTRYGMNDLLRYAPPIPYLLDFPYINYTLSVGFSNVRREYNQVIQLLKDNYYKNEHVIKYEWLKRHLLDSANFRYQLLTEQPEKTQKTRKRIRETESFMKELQKL
jgi:hypothetical protein